MNSFVVSFDKSNEGIPCLTVMRKSWFALSGESYEIINVFTGSRAKSLWNELSAKAENKGVIQNVKNNTNND